MEQVLCGGRKRVSDGLCRVRARQTAAQAQEAHYATKGRFFYLRARWAGGGRLRRLPPEFASSV
jgi:hypothetical protein